MTTPTPQRLFQRFVLAVTRTAARHWAATLALAALMMAAAPTAHAVTKVWNNAAGGNWSTAGNWTPSGAPAPGDVVDITLAGTYTVTLDVAASIGALQLGGASGTQTLASSDSALDITGAGISNVHATGVLAFSAAINRSGGALVNSGTVTLSGSAPIAIAVSNGSFSNAGILQKTGAGSANIDLTNSTFTNSALVDVLAGTLFFVNGGSGLVASSGTGNTFAAAAGTTIWHGVAANAFAGTTFSGSGAQLINAIGQTFVLTGTITAQNLNMELGTFVSDDATLAGNYAWDGPTFTAGTGLTIAPGAVVNVRGNSTVACCGARLVANYGTVNINSGTSTLDFSSSPGFWNKTSGAVNIFSTVNLNLAPGSEFRNEGTVTLLAGDLQVAGGAGPVSFSNSGTVDVNNRLLFLNAGAGNAYTQFAGTTNLGSSSGGILMANGDGITASGGSIVGRQTLAGAVGIGVSATIAPGQSPGSINVNGPYTQQGTFAVELNGPAAGTTYDQLIVSGTVTLTGTLSASLGFAPSLGTVFTIIINDGADAVTGTFSGLAEGAMLNVAGTSLQISYVGGTGNDVTLTVVAVPPAPVTAVTSTANPAAFGQSVTLTATVTGSSPTGTVQFKDGAANLGSPVALSGGQAQLATRSLLSPLAVGSHSITAEYSGDSGNVGSTSPVFIQTVNPAQTTTTIIAPLPTTITPGRSVHLLVGVAPAGLGGGIPPGTVNVMDGGSLLCAITLSGSYTGLCSGTLTTLGTHALVASYLGSASYQPSSSPASNVTVVSALPVTPIATPVPTLRDWALVLLPLLLATAAAIRLPRR